MASCRRVTISLHHAPNTLSDMRRFFPPFLLLLAISGVAGCGEPEALIELAPAERYQTISGWEVTAYMADTRVPEPRPPYWTEVYDRAVTEVGINRLRLEVRSGAESTGRNWERFSAGELSRKSWRGLRYATVNDNADPRVIDWNGFDFSELDWEVESAVLPIRQRLAARGERLFVNLCYVAFTEQIRNGAYIHSDPEEYAEFVLATYLHMQRKFGFIPDAWEVILEPDNTKQWRGRAIGRAIVAAAARLKEHGFTPRFIAPSVTDMANAAPYIDGIAAVEGAMENVIELSYHRYKNATAANLAAVVERAQRYGVDTAMLEWWFGEARPEVLHRDLKQGRNASWQGRVLIGLFNVNKRSPGGPPLTLRDDTRMNLQYFRYIRAGARRIGASSSDEDDFDPLAFVNPDGSHTVVVLAKGAGMLTVKGLPAGRYRVSYALKTESGALPDAIPVAAGGALKAEMPGAGVLTVFADGKFD